MATLAVTCCLVGCATPEGVRTKSAASQKLYADLDKAYGTYVTAMGTFLEHRDHLETAVNIAAGNEVTPAFAGGATENPQTTQVLQALGAVRAAIGIARIQYGVVDRFLQIEIFDEAQAAKVGDKLNEALKAPEE